MAVTFADLQLQYQTIKREIDDAIAAVIHAFIRGPYDANSRVRRRRSTASPAPTARTRSLWPWPH
jgi:hypothetical protein